MRNEDLVSNPNRITQSLWQRYISELTDKRSGNSGAFLKTIVCLPETIGLLGRAWLYYLAHMMSCLVGDIQLSRGFTPLVLANETIVDARIAVGRELAEYPGYDWCCGWSRSLESTKVKITYNASFDVSWVGWRDNKRRRELCGLKRMKSNLTKIRGTIEHLSIRTGYMLVLYISSYHP